MLPGKDGIPKKTVDTQTYMNTLREIVEEGHEVSLLIAGNSMNPFLADGRDVLLIQKPEGPPGKGDMVFYQRRNGQFVMHRICQVARGKDAEPVYYMIGDAQQEIEGPIAGNMIFGHITRVCRKGKWIGKGNFWWEFFKHIWIHMIPFRRNIMGIYSCFARRKE